MNLLFDNVIFSMQRAGGISVVWMNLLNELQAMGTTFRCLEYSKADGNIHHQELRAEGMRIERRKLVSASLQKCISVRYPNPLPFIFHSSIYRTCSNPNAINVITVHDFIYERQSDTSWLHQQKCKFNHRAIRNADAVVCISENTKRDLLFFLPDVDPQKVRVIYNGVSDEYSVMTPRSTAYNDYILFVGGRQGYKNFNFTVKAVAQSPYKLLVCGNALTPDEIQLLNSHLGQDRYKFILRPTNAQLNEIYNSVFCLAYPSSYEGFGLPVLEAQKAGCPVIALNSSSIPEVIGEHGMMMTGLSYEQFLSFTAQLRDSKRRNDMISAGLKNAERFSWKTMAEAYLDLYKELLLTPTR